MLCVEVVGCPSADDCWALVWVVGSESLMTDSSWWSWLKQSSSNRFIEPGPRGLRWPVSISRDDFA